MINVANESQSHDGEADPEEVEEAVEVAVVAVGVEVGEARCELNGREDAAALRGAGLFARRDERLVRGRGVFGDGCRATTEKERGQYSMPS